MNSIKICFWNANGLSQHKLELTHFLKQQQIDIILISETHFTNKSYFKIPGYTLYDTKHPSGRARGGSAILIKSRIKHYPIQNTAEDFLQATNIYLDEYIKGLVISSIYCPPRFTITETLFQNYFDSLGPKFFAAGDLNAKHTYWGSRLVTPKGRSLYNVITKADFDIVSSGTPTYWPSDRNKVPDIIDFGITKSLKMQHIKVESSLELSSDHTPTIVTIQSSPITQNPPPEKLTAHNTNWLSFKKYISSHISQNISLKTESDINKAIQEFTHIIQEAAKAATPKTEPKKPSSFNTPDEISALLREKRNVRREWQRFRSPQLKKKLKDLTKDLRRALKTKERIEFENFVSNLSPEKSTNYSLWRATKLRRKPIQRNNPIRLQNGDWAKSDAEKGQAFAHHLEHVFTPHKSVTNQTLPPQNSRNEAIRLVISKKTLNEEIKYLNTKKSPGHDLISAKMIKELPRIGKKHLLHIYNAILRTGFFPSNWKLSKIIMIPKPGKDPSQVSSYRPISLLCIFSKLLEKLLCHQLLPIIAQKRVIPNHQFGFRARHNTIEQVHRIVREIKDTFERKHYCSAVFLDVTQAFDRVWLEGLFWKLQEYLPSNLFVLIKNYLTMRRFVVKQNSYLSNEYPIKAGVPQGSVLGPLLYLLYTADMPTNNNTTISTFADDTAILSSNPDPDVATMFVQEHLNELQKWLDLWRIKVNESKSVHLTFTLRRSTCPAPKINGKTIPQCNETKYLGMHLDRRLTWKRHIEAKISQIKLKQNELNWLLNKNSKLTLNYKVQVYNTIIKPIWTYGIELWGSASPSNIEKLQRTQSKILRKMVGAPWYIKNTNIHRDLKIPMVDDEISRKINKYTQKLSTHPNALAANLLRPSEIHRLRRNYIHPAIAE